MKRSVHGASSFTFKIRKIIFIALKIRKKSQFTGNKMFFLRLSILIAKTLAPWTNIFTWLRLTSNNPNIINFYSSRYRFLQCLVRPDRGG